MPPVPYAHAVVWLDHHDAKVIQFNPTQHEAKHFKHPQAYKIEAFFHQIAASLVGVSEILVIGPGLAKTEFIQHLKQHDPAIAKAVLGVEAADHPTEGQILAHARHFFKAKDRMIAH